MALTTASAPFTAAATLSASVASPFTSRMRASGRGDGRRVPNHPDDLVTTAECLGGHALSDVSCRPEQNDLHDFDLQTRAGRALL
jgi:hypothetical protein